VVPKLITYGTVISAYEKSKQPEQALEVFEAMQPQGVVPNIIIYSALISTFGESTHH